MPTNAHPSLNRRENRGVGAHRGINTANARRNRWNNSAPYNLYDSVTPTIASFYNPSPYAANVLYPYDQYPNWYPTAVLPGTDSRGRNYGVRTGRRVCGSMAECPDVPGRVDDCINPGGAAGRFLEGIGRGVCGIPNVARGW